MNTVRLKLVTLLLFITSLGATAAPNINEAEGPGKISGSVIDASTQTPVEFATISLFKKSDMNKPVDGTMTDLKGEFTLKNIAEGEYTLKISFIGFDDKVIELDAITKTNKAIKLDKIALTTSGKLLNEVVITGQKSIIEEKVDRLVYNAESDIGAKGGDAAEILRKVPLLAVDLEGNVSIRGSSNIRVLINNKPSTIMASSIADALKMIPADEIKTVEVITSPSAKYDAEGTGGIINIITKKNNMQGLTLGIDTGIGNRASNLGLRGNYRVGKFGMTLGGFGRAMYNPSTTELEQTTNRNGVISKTIQEGTAFDRGAFGRYNLGLDYDISKTQFLSGGVRFGTRNFIRTQDFTSVTTNQDFSSSTDRTVDVKNLSSTVDLNLDYLKVIKPQQEFSISTLYSITGLTNDFESELLMPSTSSIFSKNLNGNTNQEFTLQSDYMTPLGKKQLLEFGAKGIFRSVDSDFSYLSKDENGNYVTDLRNPSGNLDYSQNVAAGYLSYTFTTKSKITLKVGSRYEYTMIDASTLKDGNISIPDYGNIVPSINISKSLKAGTTLKAAYNRRIQRPGIQQLNPNFNAANPQDIQVGNPLLSPELTDNYELALSTNIKKTYLNLSVFTRQTANSISRVRVPSDTLIGAIITTFQNIGVQKDFGANLFTNINVTQNWSINGGIDFFYSYLEGTTTGLDNTSIIISNDGFTVRGRLMTQIKLKKGWGIQGFSMIRGNEVQLQGTQSGFYMYSMGVKKDFKNKKGSVGFGAENFLTKGNSIRTTLESPTLKQTATNQLLNRGFRINFSYNIGEMSYQEKPKKKAKGVSNDDVKSGGENSNNGG